MDKNTIAKRLFLRIEFMAINIVLKSFQMVSPAQGKRIYFFTPLQYVGLLFTPTNFNLK
jgi:hypothetical protein